MPSAPSVISNLAELLAVEFSHGVVSEDLYALAITPDTERFNQFRASGVLAVLPSYAAPRISATHILALEPTPLGVLPHSLIHHLGLLGELSRYFFANLIPSCSKCSSELVNLSEPAPIPESGFLVLSVVDPNPDLSLREWCEWLESQRALIDLKLVNVEELKGESGEPIIRVIHLNGSALSFDELKAEITRWFNRGGSDLRLVHFTSREAKGAQVQILSRSLLCRNCKQPISPDSFKQASACPQCRGQGWTADQTANRPARFLACRDCDGFGVVGGISRSRFKGVFAKDLATLSFAEVMALAPHLEQRLLEALKITTLYGFGDYPLGTPISTLSPGERVRLAILSAKLSGFVDVRYLTDAVYMDRSFDADVRESSQVIVVRPKPGPFKRVLKVNSKPNSIVIRDLRQGCLDLSEVCFAMGSISRLFGPVGSGKSLLLSVIAERFAKRRKLAHLVSFGELSRCTLVLAEVDPRQSVLDLLGLGGDLAAEIAGTRRASELGIHQQDLILPNSRYACSTCGGVRLRKEPCSECLGALYDWRIAELSVGGLQVRRILTEPFAYLAQGLWKGRLLEGLIGLCPDLLRDRLVLGASLSDYSRAEQRFISLWCGLAHVLSCGAQRGGRKAGINLSKELILIDGPKVMPDAHLEVLYTLLSQLQHQGATIIYADPPEGLEFDGGCVLHLTPESARYHERLNHGYLDSRFARVSRASFVV